MRTVSDKTVAFGMTAVLLTFALLCSSSAQSTTPQAVGETPKAKAAAAPANGQVLDRVVAVANGDVILESDVDEEQRFQQVVPYRENRSAFSRGKAVQRLIDRTLILQQAEMEPQNAIQDADLDEQIARVRKDIPECIQYHCDTDAGWTTFLAAHGFTAAEFRALWLKRMELLQFIELRFRSGIKITDDEVAAYYKDELLPEYARRNVKPPPLESISKRIEEVLLQQRVGALLDDWLKSLRAQGSVKVMTPGEVMP
jgi:hypothetical protein